jgi:hypothetical protein
MKRRHLRGKSMAPAIRSAAWLAPAALIASCGGGPRIEPAPLGISYLCSGEPLAIIYNDGGFVPGASAHPASRTNTSYVPRSRARLSFRSSEHQLVADETFEDLRYVEESGQERLAWTARGERAELAQLTAGGGESPLALCSRVRSPGAAAAPTAVSAEPGRR